MHNAIRENPWYPAHVSDRADELISELDEAQLRLLYNELQTMSCLEWFAWLEAERGSICKHDWLNRAERQARLRKPGEVAHLRFQHACVWLELWRARTQMHYFHLPPSGLPLDTPEQHREMMLKVVASYHDYDERDFWPFDLPDGVESFSFRD